MEGKEMQHQGRSRSRRSEDDDRAFQEVKRNERKKKRQRPSGNSNSSANSATALSHQQQMSCTLGSSSSGGSSTSTGGGRYHHREVPPRFQHSKQNNGPKHSSKTNQAPVVVKCSQTSKCHNTKLKDLSREDGEPLSKKDLTKGSNLILEMRGKSYAVQFMYKGKGKVQKGSRENDSKKTERKRQLEVEEDVGQLRDTTNVPEVLARAKAAKVAKNKPQPPAKKTKMDSDAMDTGEKQKSKSPNTQRDMDDNTLTILDNGDKDLIVDLARRVEKLEKTLISFLEVLKTREVTSKSTEGIVMCSVKKEDDECTVGGVNVLRLPSRDAYSFALQLLDILFTKEELQSSLLFKSKKSEKPGLDQSRVEKMMRLIERRYGNEWDIKTLTAKVNQKCRDKK